jgi:hypothetical protein
VCGTVTGLFGRNVISFKAATGATLEASNLAEGDVVTIATATSAGINTVGKGVSRLLQLSSN